MTESAATIDTGTDQLLCSVSDGVAVLTLNRPEARNALSDDIRTGLRRMIPELGDNPDVGVVVLTGAGGAFCAGGDVKGMGTKSKRHTMTDAEAIEDLQQRQRGMTGALMALRKPTIAALPGAAVGAGLALALACDMRVAAQSAFIGTGYARVGLSGDYGIAWLLTRLVGTSRARELLFTAARVDAETCERLGLVNRVVPDADLQEQTMTLASQIAGGPRLALQAMKENLELALTADYLTALDHEAELLVACSRTEDHKEAVRAFVEKRTPNFRGR
jgi:enoyl-CoA hydratase/carnithine racemase